MLPETEARYRTISKHFYQVHMAGAPMTRTGILQRLAELASSIQIAYFRRLKNAIAFDLKERGYLDSAMAVLALRNPVTIPGSTIHKKAKPPRARSFSDVEFSQMVAHLKERSLFTEIAALSIIRYTGARPAELRCIFALDGKVFIPGAKKSHGGIRGADRVLAIDNPDVFILIQNTLEILSSDDKTIDSIRNRIRGEAKTLWPRRKCVPSMYSMRHQFGANLKASMLDDRAVSYIMGHQSSASIWRYGNRRQGDPKAIHVRPAEEADLAKIRIKDSSRYQRLAASVRLYQSNAKIL